MTLRHVANADLFVSLHFNAGGTADGIETYCVPPAGMGSTSTSFTRLFSRDDDGACAGNKFDERNVWLAHCLQWPLLERPRPDDRGVRRARVVVIRTLVSRDRIQGVLQPGQEDAFS